MTLFQVSAAFFLNSSGLVSTRECVVLFAGNASTLDGFDAEGKTSVTRLRGRAPLERFEGTGEGIKVLLECLAFASERGRDETGASWAELEERSLRTGMRDLDPFWVL